MGVKGYHKVTAVIAAYNSIPEKGFANGSVTTLLQKGRVCPVKLLQSFALLCLGVVVVVVGCSQFCSTLFCSRSCKSY